jgi:hypothetical protein
MQIGSNPFAKLKAPFIIANIVLALVVFGLFGGIASSTNDIDMSKQISMAGTVIVRNRRRHCSLCIRF